MNNKEQMDLGEQKIQSALGAYLRTRKSLLEVDTSSQHLDEDVLTAFVEGNLNETESKPVIAHMTDCSYCLHVSAELVKLELAFADDARPVQIPDTEPTGVGEVLSGILSRIFGANDGAVFALEEKEKEQKNDEETESDAEKSE